MCINFTIRCNNFTVTISSRTPGETAKAELYDPANKLVKTLRTIESSIDTCSAKNHTNESGFWKLIISKAEKGILDDVWIRLDPKLSGYFSIDPRQLLIVKKDK